MPGGCSHGRPPARSGQGECAVSSPGALRTELRRSLRRFGIDLVRYPESRPAHKRVRLLRHHQIDVVLDVGAGDGGYASELREFGYQGRVVSFEPLAAPYARLRRAAAGDAHWTTVNVALGDCHERSPINVAANSASSSFLAMRDEHRRAAPYAAYVGTEDVQVRRLDDVLGPHCAGGVVLLKMDVQGYEQQVLGGATRTLPLVRGVQVEMSLVPLYEGSWLFAEALQFLAGSGFELVSLEPGFTNRATGQLLQVDGIFMRPIPKS